MNRPIAIISLIAVIIGISAISVLSTYRVLSHTYDEPAHLAAGIEFLDRGTFSYEQQHPPLARLAVAIGPYLLGARAHGKSEIFDEGLAILYGTGDYVATLSAARVGVLPFFAALIAVASFWAYRDFGASAALVTAVTVATTPPLLAHAGLATTDMPLAAMFLGALFACRRWLENRTISAASIVGIMTGLAVTAKFSALVFLPASFAAITLLYALCSPEHRVHWSVVQVVGSGLCAAIAGSALVIWLMYGCSSDPVQPFRQLSAGVAEVLAHNAKGHISFFCGQISFTGSWFFFPTALLMKTPLPFLFLFGFGVLAIFQHHRHDWRYLGPLASAAVIVIVAMISRLNLGSRYILPFYPLAAIVAGIGARQLLNRSWVGHGVIGVFVAGQILVSVNTGPDYLAYFNPIAGSHPEKVLVDSDLDWGQDINRVAVELQRRGIKQVATALHNYADLSQHGFPAYSEMEWDEPSTGWVVISLTRWAFGTAEAPFDGYRWLERYTPVAIIGKTVRLYYIE